MYRYRPEEVENLGLLLKEGGEYNEPRDKSSEVILPWSMMSLEPDSVLVSQNLMVLSKWPLIMVDPDPSDVTRSLQLEPVNLVSTPVISKPASV